MPKQLEFSPLDNKYTRWYFEIIERRRLDVPAGYTENHHIQPESLGGSNQPDNMVRLTAREHYICHLLLTKMLEGEPKKRMCFAFRSMTRKRPGMARYQPNSRIYAISRAAMDFTPSPETRRKMSESGKKRAPATPEARCNISMGVKASYTPELRALRSKVFSERTVTEETRKKQSASRKDWAHMSPGVRERTRANLSARMSRVGEDHPKSKLWRLLSPAGEYFETRGLRVFCESRGLSYAAFRNRAAKKSMVPIEKGPSKGWSLVLSVYFKVYMKAATTKTSK